MGFFRRREETYNEQLLREAGLAAEQAPVRDEPESAVDPSILLGRRWGQDEWDAVATTTAPGLPGDRITFTTLPGGDVIVDEEKGDADVSPLADAVESDLRPPYKAVASRQDGDLWAIGAKRIAVEQIGYEGGDRLELTCHDGDRQLRVDGELRDGAIPELERLGRRFGEEFCVDAVRIDGDLWEIEAVPL